MSEPWPGSISDDLARALLDLIQKQEDNNQRMKEDITMANSVLTQKAPRSKSDHWILKRLPAKVAALPPMALVAGFLLLLGTAIGVAAFVLASLAGTGSVTKFDSGAQATRVELNASSQPIVGLATFPVSNTDWTASILNAYGAGDVTADFLYRWRNNGTQALVITGLNVTASPGLQVKYLDGLCTTVPPGQNSLDATPLLKVIVDDASLITPSSTWTVEAIIENAGAPCTDLAPGTVVAP